MNLEQRSGPGSYMVPQLNTGEKFEPVPLAVVYGALEGLKRVRSAAVADEPMPERIRVGSFDWWRE
ncbi:hypothetical protein [Nocardia vaccinii]|uniref:hypothetical protein n=1 Tax=Nocardia vaccinii TaxID=1822 RepID=UPI00083477E2|nr:hypothetical protein [Nocardia vaccinii]